MKTLFPKKQFKISHPNWRIVKVKSFSWVFVLRTMTRSTTNGYGGGIASWVDQEIYIKEKWKKLYELKRDVVWKLPKKKWSSPPWLLQQLFICLSNWGGGMAGGVYFRISVHSIYLIINKGKYLPAVRLSGDLLP